jgi:hypothetical protein
LPSGTTGEDYSATVAATGGTGAYSWSATGLPAGLTINSATGVISGTLLSDDEVLDDLGTYPVTVTVRDTATSARKQLDLIVNPQPLVLSVSTPPAGTSGSAYSFSFAADGGTGTVTWSATGLPPGLSVSSLSGVAGEITGAPGAVTTATTYTVTITAVDSAGATASKAVSLVINPAPAPGGL